jgi:hypothetical protein
MSVAVEISLTQHSGFPAPLVAIKAALASRSRIEKCGSRLRGAQSAGKLATAPGSQKAVGGQ